jgi:hypothetical protein
MKAATDQAGGLRQLDHDVFKLIDVAKAADQCEILSLRREDDATLHMRILHALVDELRHAASSLLGWLAIRLTRRRRFVRLLTQRQEGTKQFLQALPKRRGA